MLAHRNEMYGMRGMRAYTKFNAGARDSSEWNARRGQLHIIIVLARLNSHYYGGCDNCTVDEGFPDLGQGLALEPCLWMCSVAR